MTGSNRRPSACKADALPAELILHNVGDPYGIRTRVTAVKGRCLNRLTNGPYGREEGIRTLAPVTRPTPLAGEPLEPLGYFSN